MNENVNEEDRFLNEDETPEVVENQELILDQSEEGLTPEKDLEESEIFDEDEEEQTYCDNCGTETEGCDLCDECENEDDEDDEDDDSDNE